MRAFLTLLIIGTLCCLLVYLEGDTLVSLTLQFLDRQEEVVPTLKVEASDFSLRVPALGELVGAKTVPIRVPPIPTGSLKVAWLLEEGSIVEPGDSLIRFDDSDALLSLEESQNRYSRFEYRIEQSQQDFRGRQQVMEKDHESAALESELAHEQIRKDEEIFSRWEIEESIVSAALAEYRQKSLAESEKLENRRSEAGLEILGIDQEESADQMEEARETLAALRLTAPLGGILMHVRRRFEKLDVGAQVWSRERILEIVNLNQFRAQIRLQEKDILGIGKGSRATVRLDAYPGRELKASIQRVSRVAKQVYRIDPRRYFYCDLLLEVPDDLVGKLKPGLKLHADVEINRWENAVLLPRSALIEKGNGFVVYVKEKGEFKEEEVKVVASDHGFGVIEGVEPGQIVSLRNPFEETRLSLPDSNALSAATRGRRFVLE